MPGVAVDIGAGGQARSSENGASGQARSSENGAGGQARTPENSAGGQARSSEDGAGGQARSPEDGAVVNELLEDMGYAETVRRRAEGRRLGKTWCEAAALRL
ncbi:MAG: hypothetical protein LBL49_02575 [Clostridiales Family XIII bacterium]|nr:hypothetical protein [Clostridiales Family XIII bacterium]